ncbi:Aspartic peptidase domain,Protein of unknown function DUF1759 [Cinara cedri]|uniref:Peptidase aspartic putative domain-containing protein n=1 Tax=Cinara cedri TaxID=506608 RepID=A0A5E4MLC6_9HEMI|nr:Aspartic peptidase domain,Protein of unknown function DUF1759 [Cinara cedri]
MKSYTNEDQRNYSDAFVDMYLDVMSKAEERLAPVCDTSKEIEQNNAGNGSTFQDMFKSLVHENEGLTKVKKLHYLKMSASGEASKIIKNLKTLELNYASVWKIITERYDNKRFKTDNKQLDKRDSKPTDVMAGNDNGDNTEQNSKINAMSSTAANIERVDNRKQVLLATAIVHVLGNDGTWYTCRALLDSGLQSNLITEETMKKLKLPRKWVNAPITDVAEGKHNAEYKLSIVLRSLVNSSD